MKRLFVFLLFSLLVYQSHSQTFLSMLEEDNEWGIPAYGFVGEPFSFYITVSLGEEVIIDGKQYITLEFDGGGCGFVREENEFLFFNYLGEEYILYDFNLTVGETFEVEESCPFPAPLFGGSQLVVDVYTEFIAGQNRKIIEFEQLCSSCPAERWIEGIGSNKGFTPVGAYHDVDTELACWTNNGVTYMFNGYDACEPIASIPDILLAQINVAPNPVSGVSTLRIPAEVFADKVLIYSIDGRIISEKEVNSEFTSIDRNEFVSGIYFYQVKTNTSVIKVGKFIIR